MMARLQQTTRRKLAYKSTGACLLFLSLRKRSIWATRPWRTNTAGHRDLTARRYIRAAVCYASPQRCAQGGWVPLRRCYKVRGRGFFPLSLRRPGDARLDRRAVRSEWWGGWEC